MIDTNKIDKIYNYTQLEQLPWAPKMFEFLTNSFRNIITKEMKVIYRVASGNEATYSNLLPILYIFLLPRWRRRCFCAFSAKFREIDFTKNTLHTRVFSHHFTSTGSRPYHFGLISIEQMGING